MDRTQMRGNLDRLRRVRPRDLSELAAILVVSLRVERGLRRMPLPDLARQLGVPLVGFGEVAPDREHAPIPAWARRRAGLVALVMGHWPAGGTCLRRSLVTGNRLAELGPQLVVGVRSSDVQQIQAHAWLRIAGVDLDPLAADFHAFDGQ
jgi:hypothetical protein